MARLGLLFLVSVFASGASLAGAAVSLRETVAGRPLHDAARAANVDIRGTAGANASVRLRVTDSLGRQTLATAVANAGGKFVARYPKDFPTAEALAPGVLFIDALADAAASGVPAQAEVAVIVYRSTGETPRLPDLPSSFTTDLRGAGGGVDEKSPEWARVRALANLYMGSRSAQLAKAGKEGFDLAKPKDLQFFKDRRALYDFDLRDRDWSQPLGRREARAFWLASAKSWFGENPAFTFSNDQADLLVAALRRLRVEPWVAAPMEDNLAEICAEILANLLALQRQEGETQPSVLAVEGAGAFYYGMFTDGTLMLPGTGWFRKPEHSDHRRGGVFVGRSVWALGEALAAGVPRPCDERTLTALRAGLRWALGTAREHRDGTAVYVDTVRTEKGRELPLWRSPGEQAYLVLGMLAACSEPEARGMEIFARGEHGYARAQTTESLTIDGLDALVASRNAEGFWTRYADIDATAVAALARGAILFRGHPSARTWREAAVEGAAGWLAARPAPGDYRGEPILLAGHRETDKPGRLDYQTQKKGETHLTYFHAALWLQALAELHALTGDARYAVKFSEQLGYFCGDNAFDARLFTELGGVYNFVTDRDGDTVEDRLVFDLYPESTAFLQIALLRHLQVLSATFSTPPTPSSKP